MPVLLSPRGLRSGGAGAVVTCDRCSLLFTGGADGAIRILKGYADEDAISVDHHKEAVTFVASRLGVLVAGSEVWCSRRVPPHSRAL